MLIFTATDSNKDDSSISELEKINNNIFNSEDFISGVKENYIVCTLVYEIPSPGEKDTEENLKIQDLMNYYRVPNVPSIYLILPQGDVYALPVVTDEKRSALYFEYIKRRFCRNAGLSDGLPTCSFIMSVLFFEGSICAMEGCSVLPR